MMALMKWAQWEVFRSWVGKLALGDEVLKKGVARQEGSAPCVGFLAHHMTPSACYSVLRCQTNGVI